MAQNPYGSFRLTVGTNKSFYAMCNYLIFTGVSIALILSSNKKGGFEKPPSNIQQSKEFICLSLKQQLWEMVKKHLPNP